MNNELSFNFITGAMLGFELVTDEDANHVVIDLLIVRLVFTMWRQAD